MSTNVEENPGISIEKEMKKSYLDYAMSVIIGRALPDVRDGLKPVHRRILFAMRELKNDYNKPYKKSARIVGDVIGKYHPHGDSAVYDTIVRMAQDFSMRYPLVDGQGNFGSVDGDPPAAMRYTEVRMHQLAHEMMADLDKETVEFVPNYDESMTEPAVMPSKLPALLINGSAGIAVGMATNIPPHNILETIDAINALIDDPERSCQDLMAYIPGPDFPTGGTIYGTKGIIDAYQTGRGIIRVRGEVSVEVDRQSKRETVVVTELPYQVNKARLIEKIADMIRHKQIDGISYIRDESDRDGMRIAMGIKRDHMAEVVTNLLYKHSQLETSFGIIFLAVVDGRPQLMDLKTILTHFIRHRRDVIIRRTRYDLAKAEERRHILEGLKIALDNLDDVVALIRAAKTPPEAKSQLIDRFGLSAIQAQAILDMRLQRLTGLEQEKILEELTQILAAIAEYNDILGSEQRVLNIVKEELAEMRTQYGDERRTRIAEASGELTMADLIAEEDMVVTISSAGYIKRNPVSLYNSQRRGGRGKTAMGTRDADFVKHIFVASTHHSFLFFTAFGKVYWRKVYELPRAGRTSRGKAVVNLLDLQPGDRLTTVLAVPDFDPGAYILMATKNGLVKKTDLMAYSRPRAGGIIALDLVDGDELISARITDGTMNVFLGTANGQSIRFHESDVRASGRVSRGVRGISLKNDHIVAMEVLSYGQTLLVVTENGFGKRTSIDEYPLQRRGGKGVITVKTSERNGAVISIVLVEEDDDVMLVTSRGMLIRMPVSGISVISRNTQGVKLIGVEDGDERVVSAALIKDSDEADEDSDEADEDAADEDVPEGSD